MSHLLDPDGGILISYTLPTPNVPLFPDQNTLHVPVSVLIYSLRRKYASHTKLLPIGVSWVSPDADVKMELEIQKLYWEVTPEKENGQKQNWVRGSLLTVQT